MCQTRAFHYSCGHSGLNNISACRGTFTDARGKHTICNAAPNLTISMSCPCPDCDYMKFCDSWKARLADAEEKRSVAMQMMHELEHNSQDCSELDDSLIGSSNDPIKGIWGDTQMVQRELQRANEELGSIKDQYRREAGAKWGFPLRRAHSISTAALSLRQPRQPASRATGRTPLRQVQSATDIPTTSLFMRKEQSATGANMSRSPSLVSDSGDDSVDSSDEGDHPIPAPPLFADTRRRWQAGAETPRPTASELSIGKLGHEIAIVDDDNDEDVMFPNYGA